MGAVRGAGRALPAHQPGVPGGGAPQHRRLVVRPGVRVRLPGRAVGGVPERRHRAGLHRGGDIVDILIGVDVGQKVDPTAVAVIEHQWRGDRKRDGFDDHYVVRYLERLPLGTAYPLVAERLAEIVTGVRARVERVTVPLGPGAVEIKERTPHVTL